MPLLNIFVSFLDECHILLNKRFCELIPVSKASLKYKSGVYGLMVKINVRGPVSILGTRLITCCYKVESI